ncbi:MAG: HD domain-containing protein [archaeon]|nr:HD domain-containing protein [archaeon]
MKCSNLNMDLIYQLFNAVNIHRWNDHLRHVDFTELDKQSHKAAIAWFLGKYEETEKKAKIDWKRIIEGCMFSFLKRTVLTDLRPQVLHKVEKEKFDEINNYVISEIGKSIPNINESFMKRFKEYLGLKEYKDINYRIVSAAHDIATIWEFNIIYDMNKSVLLDIENTKKLLDLNINNHSDLAGVKYAIDDKSRTFIDLVGQLRFQKRWTRLPRIPETTVLGHSLIVANMMYLYDLDKNVEDHQVYNDYYTALFHDLPEALTKDVISPVKKGIGMDDILKKYEDELIKKKIMPLLPWEWSEEFSSLVSDPFKDKDNRDSRSIKICDKMSAFIEAYVSEKFGIHSSKLSNNKNILCEELKRCGEPWKSLINRLYEIEP